jgi:hypothetical protein
LTCFAKAKQIERDLATLCGMRIYMQARPALNENPKYLQLILQQDLLGGWSLIKESGQQGGKASLKREQYLDLESAQNALISARDAQLKKGFSIMFAEGEEPPGRTGHG